MKVWITKYALTKGIIEVEVDSTSSGSIIVKTGDLKGSWFYHTHYCTSKQEAIVKANEMRRKKIDSLKKQIDKLEKMKFV